MCNKQFLYATAMLVGTIVGVGIFGLPYVASQSGFFVGLFFLLGLGFIVTLIHLLYGEVVLRTNEKHRLAGFAGIYLGDTAKRVVSVSSVLGLFGALLAYILMAGKFLEIVVGPWLALGDKELSLVFYGIGIIFVYAGVRAVSKIEFFMTFFLVFVVGLLFFRGLPEITVSYLTTFASTPKSLVLPYGVVLFSLGGVAAIPELPRVLGIKRSFMRKVIIAGTLIPVVLYILFVFSIVGMTGSTTHPEAIPGLIGIMGPGVIFIGALFGLAAVATSFLVLGLNLQEIFWYDYGLSKRASWALMAIVPLVLFLGGITDFIGIIGTVGAVMGGINGVFIVMIHKAAQRNTGRNPEYSIRIPSFVRFGLFFVFILGIAWHVFDILI